MIFQYLSGTFSAAFPAMTPPPKPMHARARWSSRRKSLPACSDFRRELHPTSLDHAFGNALTSFRLPACIQVVGGWGWKGGAAMIRRRRLQYIYIYIYIYIYELLKKLKCTGWSRNSFPYGKTYGKPTANLRHCSFLLSLLHQPHS